jgi:hypothetical protein
LTLEPLESRDVPSVTVVSAPDPSFQSTSATANGQSETSPEHSLSADGKSLVYVSFAYNLVAGETRNSALGGTTATQNVYLYNTATKTSTLISSHVGTGTEQANAASFDPVISADGSTVAFFSYATDLLADQTVTSGTVQLYLYDVGSGQLTRVTSDSADPNKGSDATNPIIPPGGVTTSTFSAVNTLGYYTGINLGLGSIVGGGVGLPSLSSDGKFVAFISNASDMIAGDTMPTTSDKSTVLTQVFLYDKATNALALISHKAGDTTTGGSSSVGDSFSSTAAISADGSTVAFTTPFDDLITGGSNLGLDDNLYVWSRIDNTNTTGLSAGQTVLASHTVGSPTTGATIDATQFLFGFTADTPPSLSDNGAFVAYYDAGSDLVNATASTQGTASVLNVFRYDVKNNTNLLVTHVANSGTTMGDNPANQIAQLGVGPAEATGPIISANGEFIAYANNSSNLISPSFGSTYNGADQVYLFDANAGTNGTNTLVSHADGSTTTPSGTGGTAPAMSTDGRFVSYVDWAYPASGTVTKAEGDVRVFDSQSSSPTAIPPSIGTAFDPNQPDDTAAGVTGAQINSGILAPTVMSADGRMVVWDGNSTTNVTGTPADNNKTLDVFFVDQAPTPTQFALPQTDVPALNNYTFPQFQVTAGGNQTFQFVLVTPTSGPNDNAQFVINNGQLQTASNFTGNLQNTYVVTVKAFNPTFPSSFIVGSFPERLVRAPNPPTTTQTQIPNLPNTTVAQFQSTDPTSGRTVQFALVPGAGDNAQFTIDPITGELKTGPNFTAGGKTSLTAVVLAYDSAFPTLTSQSTTVSFALVQAPTGITASTTSIPALANTQVTQFVATNPTSGRTDTFSLVNSTSFPDNLKVTLDPTTGELTTGAGFPTAGQTNYQFDVEATDSVFTGLKVDQVINFFLVNAATSIMLSNTSFTAGSNQTVGTLSVPGSNRTYTYTLVSGFGDNSKFAISGTSLVTGPGFPSGAATYTVKVTVTDSQFPGLTFTQTFTIHANPSVINTPPAKPILNLPATVLGFQGTPVALNISSAPGDPSSTVMVTISGVPADVTFSAGTNNGNGSWTFTPSQLVGLMLTAASDESFVLHVTATATAMGPSGATTTVSGLLSVMAQIPTFTISVPATVNPLNVVTATLDTTGTGTVTINWGDGTSLTVPAGTSSVTHQYAVTDGTYPVQATLTGPNGTVIATSVATVTAALATQSQAVVAALYLDLLGRSADQAGLTNFSSQMAAGVPISAIVTALESSGEYQTAVINSLYQKYLGRPVDPTGLAIFLPLLKSSGPEVVAAAIIGSQEFYNNAGGTALGFVQALYQTVLGRAPDPSAMNLVTAVNFGIPLEQIALAVLKSPEAAQDAVQQDFLQFLGRVADAAGLAFWTQRYLQDPATFLVSFLGTPEFEQRVSSTSPAPSGAVAMPG